MRSNEADCMYSGIMVDTNNFTAKTGVRTFEAAAFLRRYGADVTRVRKMFRDGALEYKAKAETIRNAEIYKNAYAMGICPAEGLESPTEIGAQAANELLGINGIKASFVMTEYNGKIYFDYDCLRLKTLGLEDTNVLTEENALAAIDEISSALEMISAQRSLFGAYQNRMEHAYNIDKNSAENTQAAESQIRDTDMAKEMVQYSNLNILGQAGQSMLAQANQKNQGILTLLG